MWEQWGVEISAYPLTWHIAYTTACCYRTSRDAHYTYIAALCCCSFWYDEIRFRRILPFLKLRHLFGSFSLFPNLLLFLQPPSVFLHSIQHTVFHPMLINTVS